jgi:hypothetical protein
MRLISGREQHGDETSISGLSVVEVLGEYGSLPAATESSSGFLHAPKAAFVCFGANDEDEVGFLDLTLHPTRPAFRGRLFVLVDVAVDAFLAQTIGKLPYAALVLGRVVTVTYENLRWNLSFRRHNDHYIDGLTKAA